MSRAREIADLVGGTTPDIILKTSDGAILNLQTSDTTVTANSILGEINFQAPDEASGTDAILIASKIQAVAEGTFSSSSNATSLVFTTANSAAAGTASGKMTFTSGGELILKDTDTADGSSPTITLQSGDTDIAADDVLGTINFQAPDEGAGTDAILVAAGMSAISEGDFSSSNNATSLVFKTGASAAADEKMRINSAGRVGLSTTAPLHILDIEADTTGSIPTDEAMSTSTDNDNYFGFHNVNNSATFSGLSLETRTSGAARWLIANEWKETYKGDLVFRTRDGGSSSSEVLRIANSGKVGIGIAAPLRQLHISDTSANSEIAFTAATNGVSSLLFGDGQTGTDVYRGYVQYNHTDDALLFASGAAEGLRLKNGGNLEKTGDTNSARIIPQSDNAGFLGENSHRWEALFAVSGTIQTSDKNMKTEITNSALGLDFVKALRPVSYKWISGGKHFEYAEDDLTKSNPTITDVAGKRNHYGLIAQEVKEALGDTDFGGWVSEDVTDENATQSLRYDQFIAPLVKAVQELSAEVETLKTKVAALEDA